MALILGEYACFGGDLSIFRVICREMEDILWKCIYFREFAVISFRMHFDLQDLHIQVYFTYL